MATVHLVENKNEANINLSLLTKSTAGLNTWKPLNWLRLQLSEFIRLSLLTSLDEGVWGKDLFVPGFRLSKANGLNHGSRVPSPAEHQWLITHDNTAGPWLTEEMPELKSCFHGNRLSSSWLLRHLWTLVFLSRPWQVLWSGAGDGGHGVRKEKGTIKPQSFTKEIQVHFMSLPHILEYEKRSILPLKRPFSCWWKNLLELFKGQDLRWADGNSPSPHLLLYLCSNHQVSPHNAETVQRASPAQSFLLPFFVPQLLCVPSALDYVCMSVKY